MGYCTIQEVERILAQALTSSTDASSQARRSLLEIGSQRNSNLIPDSNVEQFIQWSGQEIDAALSGMYNTPLCEEADFETTIIADISEYNSYIITASPCPIATGDVVVLVQGGMENRFTIEDQIDPTIYTTAELIPEMYTAGARLVRVKFPDPLPFICARMAAANIYEKYFAAQVGKQQSEYGKFMRMQARQKLNDILNGRTVLHGVHRIGRRLYDSTIVDQYGLKEGSAEKNTDDLR